MKAEAFLEYFQRITASARFEAAHKQKGPPGTQLSFDWNPFSRVRKAALDFHPLLEPRLLLYVGSDFVDEFVGRNSAGEELARLMDNLEAKLIQKLSA